MCKPHAQATADDQESSQEVPGRFSKVFGIGLSKTGTSSLQEALNDFGYVGLHNPHPYRVMEQATVFNSLTDTPVVLYWQALRCQYPGAGFILTVRQMASWLDSCEAHWNSTNPDGISKAGRMNRRAVFGRVDFDRAWFCHVRRTYEAHIKAVFHGPWADRLLVINVCDGSVDRWKRIGRWLGVEPVEIPTGGFPHMNKRKE